MSQPTKFVKIVSPLALAIALAACGGGGGEFSSEGGGTPGGGGGDPVIVASSIEVSASSRQLASDGLKPVVITAIAKDTNNNAIETAIVFAVDSGATLNIVADAGGSIKTADLIPSSFENRTLKVKVSSGSHSKTILVDVVGTSVVIDGPDAITLNKEVPFVLKLKDSGNKPISFETVELTSSAGNTITTESNYQTDAIGEIAFNLTGIAGGTDTLTAKVLGAEYTKEIGVSGDEFVLSANSEEITINTDQTIKFLWTKEGAVQANKPITISATRGSISPTSVVTNSAGEATFTISSTTSGQTVITATSVDGLSTSLRREFIATTPSYLNTQAGPTLIAPNASSTIVAKIRDINDNPVKNKVIDFRLTDTVDGTLSASTAVTDSLGRASVSYTAGNSSSAKDGVIISTFIQGYPAVEMDEVKLTVGGNALRMVLGHDHVLAPDDLFYIKQFGVIATDSAGNPVKDQEISFKIIPTRYYKGKLNYDILAKGWRQEITARCDSEDFDNDGNLDAGEDVNDSGTLEPTHDATVTGSGITDENGKIVVEVIYPKNTAWWTDQRIESSTIVDGTEYKEFTDFYLPVLAVDVSSEGTPPNVNSPYGTWGGCTDKPDADQPASAVEVKVVNALLGTQVRELVHNVWYSISGNGSIVAADSYTLSDDYVTIEKGPNNTFKLVDKDIAVDSSGFYITLTIGGKNIPLYYQDDAAIAPRTTE